MGYLDYFKSHIIARGVDIVNSDKVITADYVNNYKIAAVIERNYNNSYEVFVNLKTVTKV